MGRKNQAYEFLKKAIVNNEIPQGSPIRELELSKTLKMSRTPIREALRELETEGVIVSYPSQGTFVATITPYDVEEIYELRMLHELWALEKGFSRITDTELDKIEKLFIETNDDFEWEKYHQADRAFHQMIIDKSGSRRLAIFVDTLNIQIEQIRRYSAKDPTRKDTTFSEHMKIIHCIRERDLQASKLALQEHLRLVADSAIEACKQISYENSLTD